MGLVLSVYVCVRACVRACVSKCVRARVHVCMSVCVFACSQFLNYTLSPAVRGATDAKIKCLFFCFVLFFALLCFCF